MELKQAQQIITVADLYHMSKDVVGKYVRHGSYYWNYPRTLRNFDHWFGACFLMSYVGTLLEDAQCVIELHKTMGKPMVEHWLHSTNGQLEVNEPKLDMYLPRLPHLTGATGRTTLFSIGTSGGHTQNNTGETGKLMMRVERTALDGKT